VHVCIHHLTRVRRGSSRRSIVHRHIRVRRPLRALRVRRRANRGCAPVFPAIATVAVRGVLRTPGRSHLLSCSKRALYSPKTDLLIGRYARAATQPKESYHHLRGPAGAGRGVNEPYTTPKEPYTAPKEPHITPKEPYITPKKRELAALAECSLAPGPRRAPSAHETYPDINSRVSPNTTLLTSASSLASPPAPHTPNPHFLFSHTRSAPSCRHNRSPCWGSSCCHRGSGSPGCRRLF